MYIVGGLDDQTILLAWSKISNLPFKITDSAIAGSDIYPKLFFGLLNPWLTHRPLSETFISFFLSVFHSYNLFLFLTMLANFCCSYLLFRKLKYGPLYAVMFSFSSYLWSHLGIHVILIQLWVIPLFFYLLEKYDAGKIKPFVLGLYLAGTVLISNYYGFFLCLAFAAYTFVSFWKSSKKGILIRRFFVVTFVCIVVSMIFLLPYMRRSFIDGTGNLDASLLTARAYEDFFSFSSRPWYFFIPPVKNPWFGEISSVFLERIEATNYFLADDYFATEHSGNYFGLLFLVVFGIVFFYSLLRGDATTKRRVLLYFGTVLILLLFSLPPFFTISGFKFWTPGFLIFKFFPVFRVTARLTLVVHVCLLLIMGYGLDFIYQTLSIRWKRVLTFFMFFFLFVTLMETFIPPKVQVVSKPIEPYFLFSEAMNPGTTFAVYPYSETQEALFWIDAHRGILLNPGLLITDDINTKVFTKSLLTKEGLMDLKFKGGEYLFVFKNASDTDLEFFSNVTLLKLVWEFDNSYVYAFY